MTARDVVILGSTGSIGTQTLDLVRANPDRFRVVALTAGGSNPDLFERRSRSSRPAFTVWARTPASRRPAWPCDVVLNGITGAVGLRPTLAALEAGNTLALANKESLIIGGPLVTGRAKPGQIVPIDSEHSALAQCLRGGSSGGGTPAGADRERRPVPRPHPRPARRRDRRAGAGPPDLGDGADGDDQLGDPGQQGPRGDRGPPALRHPVRPDRGRGPPDQRRALDGGVRRRLDARPGQPADHDDPDRARPELAGPGARRRPARRLDEARDLGVLPARPRRVPRRVAGPRGRRARRHRPGGLQRRERGVRRGVPRRAARVHRHRSHSCQHRSGSTTYPRRRSSPSTTSSRPTRGPATAHTPSSRGPHDRRSTTPSGWCCSSSPSWRRSACTSSVT